MSSITLTPIDAARRQLATAIELWVLDGDPVSIHTLASAAHQIVHDLNAKAGGEPFLFDSPLIKAEHRKDVINRIKSHPNFFKHADRSPAEHEFPPDTNEWLIAFILQGLNALKLELTAKELAFRAWNGLQHPDVLTAEGQAVIDAATEGMATLAKREFFEAFQSLHGAALEWAALEAEMERQRAPRKLAK